MKKEKQIIFEKIQRSLLCAVVDTQISTDWNGYKGC